MKEEDRLQNQIAQANKHSYLADITRQRVEYEQRFKEAMKQAEMDRVQNQRRLNENRRLQTLEAIKHQKNAVVNHAHHIRSVTKEFLT